MTAGRELTLGSTREHRGGGESRRRGGGSSDKNGPEHFATIGDSQREFSDMGGKGVILVL